MNVPCAFPGMWFVCFLRYEYFNEENKRMYSTPVSIATRRHIIQILNLPISAATRWLFGAKLTAQLFESKCKPRWKHLFQMRTCGSRYIDLFGLPYKFTLYSWMIRMLNVRLSAIIISVGSRDLWGFDFLSHGGILTTAIKLYLSTKTWQLLLTFYSLFLKVTIYWLFFIWSNTKDINIIKLFRL